MISIIPILIVLFVVGFCLWLLEKAPLDGNIKQIIYGISIVAVIAWLFVTYLLPMLHGVGVH